MNVLSLFDGMSCGMIALDRLGIKVDNYYAAEIDKYATQVSEANYPDIIRLGDVCGVKAKDLPKIDLILAGSPCQGFSFAGKQLAFDDPRSMLFFEFVRLLKECKPKYFLLENVRMKKEYLDVISDQVGVQPIFINSSLVSAQSRQRYYWTNIPGIEQPKERGIVLRDILEGQPTSPTLMSDKFIARNGDRNCMIDESKEKAHNLSAMEYVKNGRQGNYLACDEDGSPKHKPVKKTERNARHLKQLDDKSLCMTATMYKGAGNNGMTLVPEKLFDESLDKMTNKDGKAHCVTATYQAAQPHNSMERKQRTMIPVDMNEDLPENINRIYDNDSKSHKPKRIHLIPKEELNDFVRQRSVYSEEGKSPCLLARSDSPKIMKKETHDNDSKSHKPIKVGMNVEEVKIRKHEVDIPNLQQCILDHYAKCGKDKKQIARDLNDKYSTVEHYFRKVGSKFFSIPSEEHWPQLKEILGITTDKFDAQIMEFEYQDGVYETKQRVYSENGKSPTLTAGNKEQYIETHNNPKQVGTAVDIKGHDQIKRVYSPNGKSPTVTTCGGGHREPKVVSGAWRARSVDENGKRVDWKETTPQQMLELRKDEKTNSVTSVQKDNVLTKDNVYWRKLTPLECERLQTVPDNYTNHVSNTQRYKMLGNGWTIEVIAHIFENMKLLEDGKDLPKPKGQDTFDF